MGREVIRKIGRQHWHADADFAEALLPAGEGEPAWLASERLEPVKGGHGRRTARVTVGDRRFYVKQYHGRPAARRARREWLSARWAAAAGLATPRPAAACWTGGRAVYVTADAGQEGRPLGDLVYETWFEPTDSEPPYPGHRPPEMVRLYRRRRTEPAAEAPTPRTVARLIADLLIEMHSLGLRHRDLHPNNLMLVGRGDDRRLMVLDLVELEEMPGRASLVDHLVQLNHFFEPLATRTERLRVLKLLEARGLRLMADAGRIEAATWAYRRRFYRGRDRRCLRQSKYFRLVKMKGIRGAFAADWADRLPESPEALLAALEVREPLKQSRREVSGFATLGGQRVFIKRDVQRNLGRLVGQWLRGTRQQRAWRMANGLLIRGIGTARPLAWFDVGRGLPGCRGVLVCEALDGWQSLDLALPEQSGATRAAMVETVARQVRRMHEAGISNRDLKAQNILVRYDGGRWRVALVDMVGLGRHRGAVGRGRRVQNLMRLAFSWSGVGVSGQARGLTLADRLRFLKTYLGPHIRQTVTVRCRPRPARREVERVRRWWRGIGFSLGEKAARQKR